MSRAFRFLFPTRALFVLLAIGLVDLVSTAVLHSRGQIVELNPVMRPLIEHSEWTFVFTKGLTLILAWYFIAKYARTHLEFARRACLVGSGAYIAIWLGWFLSAR